MLSIFKLKYVFSVALLATVGILSRMTSGVDIPPTDAFATPVPGTGSATAPAPSPLEPVPTAPIEPSPETTPPAPPPGPEMPPNFSDVNSNVLTPTIWKPTSPETCTIVYAPGMTAAVNYSIAGGGNPVPGDRNYFFYFPQYDQVLSFIDPKEQRIYPKGILDGSYGITLHFNYHGGFPPGFNILGPENVVGGDVKYFNGDNFDRHVFSDWPFIQRSSATYNVATSCRLNGNCYCIR